MDNLHQAAILLFGLGEKHAAEILRHLDQKQVEKLINIMNKLDKVSEEDIIDALSNFFEESHTQTGLGVASNKFIRKTLINAVGSEKATSLIDKAALGEKARGLEILGWQPAQVIADILQDEHPQVIAVSLTYLDSEKAAQVISLLSKERVVDVIKRITRIGPISPSALTELAKIFEEALVKTEQYKELPLGGIDTTANIVNFLNSDLEHEVITHISSTDEVLANQIQERMFPFEKLESMDTRSLQTLLREVSNDDLVMALKGVEETVRKTFFKNMSERAAGMLKDDLEAQGPVQLNRVQDAQKRIVATAQHLANEGKIVISKGDDNMVM